MQLNGKPHIVLFDAGCTQSLFQSQLIPTLEYWNEKDTVLVTCVYGHDEQACTT